MGKELHTWEISTSGEHRDLRQPPHRTGGYMTSWVEVRVLRTRIGAESGVQGESALAALVK